VSTHSDPVNGWGRRFNEPVITPEAINQRLAAAGFDADGLRADFSPRRYFHSASRKPELRAMTRPMPAARRSARPQSSTRRRARVTPV